MDVPSQIRRTCQSEDAKGKLYIFLCLSNRQYHFTNF